MNSKKLPTENGKKMDKDYTKPGVFQPGHAPLPGAGRPTGSVDPVKDLAKKIAEKRISLGLNARQRKQLEKQGFVIEEITILERILLDWATSNNVNKQEKFIERVAGKVPNVNQNQNSSFDFMKHADKFTDAELEAIRDGADPLEILFSKLPSIKEED